MPPLLSIDLNTVIVGGLTTLSRPSRSVSTLPVYRLGPGAARVPAPGCPAVRRRTHPAELLRTASPRRRRCGTGSAASVADPSQGAERPVYPLRERVGVPRLVRLGVVRTDLKDSRDASSSRTRHSTRQSAEPSASTEAEGSTSSGRVGPLDAVRRRTTRSGRRCTGDRYRDALVLGHVAGRH